VAIMSDDAAFLAAIKAAPSDDTPRLVYADWLDEQGRPGSDFLRIECDLAALDPTDYTRWLLLDKMRVASLDLDEAWVAAVSRTSVDEINHHVREIQSRLRRRITGAELPAQMAEWEWMETKMQPGDELWEYNTAEDTWPNLHGEMGYAIVRNGKVVEYRCCS
jgi:uncharacterized protein (TIGR02996 family)